MKRQKNMDKMVLAPSSALTTFLLLLQCYGILALKELRDRSRLNHTALEAILPRKASPNFVIKSNCLSIYTL